MRITPHEAVPFCITHVQLTWKKSVKRIALLNSGDNPWANPKRLLDHLPRRCAPDRVFKRVRLGIRTRVLKRLRVIDHARLMDNPWPFGHGMSAGKPLSVAAVRPPQPVPKASAPGPDASGILFD